ncbi:MAG: type I restriction enzyme HsdR N-terminal domain-containing protein, partial [Tissierellia bacterium]|nr:type I restriction enzyme HsdR N-terminal domain-containing protein [Tissierellia bacterium]
MFELKNYNQLKLRILQKDKVSEEDVRQAINLDIKSYLKEKYDMIIDFKNEVLTHKNTLIDSKYGNFIIEYKKPDVNISDKQRNQLIDYLHTLDKYSWGIITNGISLEIYHYSYEEKTFVRNDSFSGEINLEQFTYICNIIANKDNLILTENNINEILGLENNKSIIRKIYSKIIVSTNVRTKLLYSEWQKLFHISDEYDNLDLEKKHEIIKFYEELFNQKINNVQEEYKALFAIQTYYSIILKIVLYKLILNKTKEKFSKPKFVKEMFANLENNSLFRKSNIMN